MSRRPIERFFVAWTAGTLVGLAALALEWALLGSHPGVRSLSAYALLGGAAAAVGRSIAAFALAAQPARLATLAGMAAFAALEVVYYANVYLLPAEHYLSFKSLALDAVVLAAFVVPFFLAGHSRRVSSARDRFSFGLAITGFLMLLTASFGVARALPPLAVTTAPATANLRPGTRDLDIYLIVLDSVRRDRVWGPDGPRITPTLQALTSAGRVYSNAFAASSWTVPSVAEMLRSGAEHRSQATLAQELAAAGWLTASFSDNPHLWRGSALLRGFGRVSRSVSAWREPVRGTVLGEVVERLAPGDDIRLTRAVGRFLEEHRQPVFVYVHLMDAHAPYRFPRLDGRRSRVRRIEFPLTGMVASPEEEEDVRARYDAGVKRADTALSEILGAIRTRGRRFLAIVTADHGESLGESGRWFHGSSLAPELVAVPLVVVGEASLVGRVDAPASNRDLRRTILDSVGLPCDSCGEVDLRTATESPVAGGLPPRLLFRIADGFKLVLDHKTGSRQLFDLARDPLELRNVLAEHPKVADVLSDGLTPLSVLRRPPDDAAERLRALGYSAP